MNTRYEKYLGIDANGNVVNADFGIRDGMFTASFDANRPIREDDYDLDQMFKDRFTVDELGQDLAFDLCKRFDCAPSMIPEAVKEDYANNGYGNILDLIDCSLFPEQSDVNGDTWFFEGETCGQTDIFKAGDFISALDKEAVCELYELWQSRHLKKLPDEGTQLREQLDAKIQTIVDALPDKGSDEAMEHICTQIERSAYSQDGEYLGYDPARIEPQPMQPPSLKEEAAVAQAASKELASTLTARSCTREI